MMTNSHQLNGPRVVSDAVVSVEVQGFHPMSTSSDTLTLTCSFIFSASLFCMN